MNYKYSIVLYFIIFLIVASCVSAATRYWIGEGVNLSINSDTDLFIDTTNNKVGINTATPDSKLQVVGNVMIGETDATGGILYLYGTAAGKYSTMYTSNGNLHIDSGYGVGANNNLNLNWGSGSTIYFGTGASGAHSSTGTTGAWNFDNTLYVSGAGKVGIGDATPDYLLDVEGTGTVAYFYSSAGTGLLTTGTTRGIEARASSTSGRGVYGYASSGSGTTYGVYGQATTGYSGYFTGGRSLYADGYEVFQRGNCHYASNNNYYVNCPSGYDHIMGGGADCQCGNNQMIGSYPYSATQWRSNCRNCNAGDWNTWVICCGY